MSTSSRPVGAAAVDQWVGRHRFLTFVVLAYAISWSLWLVAAAIVTARTGHSLADWIRPVWRWRVPVRWWLYALGLPALLYVVVTLLLQLVGAPVDWSLGGDRLPDYLSTFVFVLFLGGALDEPGWRGFGLPVLQERYSPLRATLILGLVWGVWHVPVYGPAGFVVPAVLAFFYTLLWNATRSVGLCILLWWACARSSSVCRRCDGRFGRRRLAVCSWWSPTPHPSPMAYRR
jgi:membrane protease YdiL (CAAX protease family)